MSKKTKRGKKYSIYVSPIILVDDVVDALWECVTLMRRQAQPRPVSPPGRPGSAPRAPFAISRRSHEITSLHLSSTCQDENANIFIVTPKHLIINSFKIQAYLGISDGCHDDHAV